MSEINEIETEIVTFHCLTEYNDWEGERWYHYFQDEPGVYDILSLIQENDVNDFDELETVSVTWKEAERLTNLDTGGYIQEHWFGRLTNLEGLKQADSQTLYKGGIRDFGEELFSYDDNENDEEVIEVTNQ